MSARSYLPALAIWLLACTPVEKQLPPVPPPPPPPDGPATVLVLDVVGNGPLPGISVVVNDADGGYLETLITNDDGIATVEEVPTGGSITVVRPYDNSYDLTTIFEIEPGDELVMGRKAGRDWNYVGSMEVLLPVGPGNNDHYIIHTKCGEEDIGSSTSGDIEFLGFCQDGEFSVFALAQDFPISAYSIYSSGHTFAAGGTIDLTGATWLPGGTYTVALTQLPAGLNYISALWNATEDGFKMGRGYGLDDLDTEPNAVTIDIPSQDGGDGSNVLIELHRSNASDQIIREQRTANRYDNSYPAMALPMLSWPLYSFEDKTLSWSEQIPGAAADAFRAMLFWTTGPDEAPTYFTWTFIGSPERTSLHVPTMPASLGDIEPTFSATSSDTCNQSGCPHIELIETDVSDGYRDMRQEPDVDWRFVDREGNVSGLPPEKRIRISGMFLDMSE
ncbi:MAG: hypothetical protein IPL79_07525 [Myxococcales bacterium]|nr:hypothetical protein [Myxococcales bacterium]